MDAKSLLDIKIQAEILITRREALCAENALRQAEGLVPAYDEKMFDQIKHELELLLNVLRSYPEMDETAEEEKLN